MNFERVGNEVRETFRQMPDSSAKKFKQKTNPSSAERKNEKALNDSNSYNASISSDDEKLNDKINT